MSNAVSLAKSAVIDLRSDLKQQVRAHWQQETCGTRYSRQSLGATILMNWRERDICSSLIYATLPTSPLPSTRKSWKLVSARVQIFTIGVGMRTMQQAWISRIARLI